ncbi:hypothetical protein RRG08_000105 [Elysia crispata]|uniref:Uncharacterized protein n=1 Tax=Elysia crispata TaxID=231223 RepID=A0AAE1D8L8_9GAST|nr:hypothetical protein RRG08_000105 [Elysia crispata]
MEGDMERFLLYHYRSQNHNGGRHGEVSPTSLQVTEPQWRATWRGFSYIITGHRTTMEGDMERFLLHHYRSQNHNGGRHGEVSPTSLQVTEPQWRATWRGFSYIITGHRTTMEGDMERFLLHHYRSQNHNGGRHGEVSPTSLQVTEPQWRATWRGFSYIITGHRTTMEGDMERFLLHHYRSQNHNGGRHGEVSPIITGGATWRGFSYIITGHRTTMEGDMERFLLHHYRSQNHNGGRHGEVSPTSLQVTEPQWRATWRGFSYIITGHRTTMEGDMERFLLHHYRSQNHNGGRHGEVSPTSLQVTEPQWRATWRGFSYIITGHRTTMEGDMERFLLHHYRSQNHNGGRHGEVSPTSLQVTEPQWRGNTREARKDYNKVRKLEAHHRSDVGTWS